MVLLFYSYKSNKLSRFSQFGPVYGTQASHIHLATDVYNIPIFSFSFKQKKKKILGIGTHRNHQHEFENRKIILYQLATIFV